MGMLESADQRQCNLPEGLQVMQVVHDPAEVSMSDMSDSIRCSQLMICLNQVDRTDDLEEL